METKSNSNVESSELAMKLSAKSICEGIQTADVGFVLGPGRSGTTLLYKLLCLHPQVAYLSNFETRLGWLPPLITGRARLSDYHSKLTHWFNDSGNAYLISRPWMRKLIPNPVEGERLYTRLGMPSLSSCDDVPDDATAYRFQQTFEKIRNASGSRILVSKRTANNRRVPSLEAIFNQPLYVNLLRDGRDVAASLMKVDWWQDHRLWWDELERTPADIFRESGDSIALCARNWIAEVEEIERGLEGVDPLRILDVRYEELLTDPVAQMNRIVEYLGLDRFQEFENAIKSLGLVFKPSSWRRSLSAEQVAVVESIQGPYLDRLGYA